MTAIDSERIAKANQAFLSAILKGRIEDIAQAAHTVYNMPVVILDNAGRVICQVPNKPIGYWLWDEWVASGRVSLELNLEAIKFFNENVEPGKNAFYSVLHSDTGVRTGMTIRFYENSICAGHCGIMIGDYVPDETDMAIAEILSNVLTHFYSRESKKISSNIYRNAYLAKLLSGEADNADLGVMDYNLSMAMPKDYIVLVSQIPELYKSNAMGYYICDNIERSFSRTIPIVYHDHLVIVCYQLTKLDCQDPCQSERISPVLNYLSEYKMPTGISTGFSDIRALNSYYEQAYMTLTIGLKLDPRKQAFLFSDYVPYQMMKLVSQPQAFLHPLVQNIRIYDRKRNTEYYKTFKTYMLAGKDKKFTADRLNIHLNTLKYRLNMINDLFLAEPLSKREELHVVLSFLLDDFENGETMDTSL